MPVTVSDLRQCPEFFEAVAERIWQAWWKPRGHPLDTIRGRLRENMTASPIPLALVAHQDAAFLGTASVIAADLDERPQFTPWVAAVWVEPTARSRGIGAALVDHAAKGLLRTRLRARLSLRPARACKLLSESGLDRHRTGHRTAPNGRLHPRRRRWQAQPFAAMRIARPNPVR